MSTPSLSPKTEQGRTPAAGQITLREVLSFKLGAEEYGIDILKVREIRGYEQPTRMAGMPDYIKGVVNLRGVIVPIIDMRIKFRLDTVAYNEFTVVIILNLSNGVVGMVVDSVSDVTTLHDGQVKPAPEFSATIDTRYIMGLGTIDQRMLILVDIERLMAGRELELMANPAIQ